MPLSELAGKILKMQLSPCHMLNICYISVFIRVDSESLFATFFGELYALRRIAFRENIIAILARLMSLAKNVKIRYFVKLASLL
jgi:hypothetical protein